MYERQTCKFSGNPSGGESLRISAGGARFEHTFSKKDSLADVALRAAESLQRQFGEIAGAATHARFNAGADGASVFVQGSEPVHPDGGSRSRPVAMSATADGLKVEVA